MFLNVSKKATKYLNLFKFCFKINKSPNFHNFSWKLRALAKRVEDEDGLVSAIRMHAPSWKIVVLAPLEKLNQNVRACKLESYFYEPWRFFLNSLF